MSATEYIEDGLIRHHIDMLRHSNVTAKQLKETIDKLAESVMAELLSAHTTDQVARYGEMQAQTAMLAEQLETDGIISNAVSEIAGHEPDFMAKLYSGAVSIDVATVAPEIIVASANSKYIELISGKKVSYKNIQQLVSIFDKAAAENLLTIIQSGIVEGKPVASIAREIMRVTKSQLYRNALSLARTVNMHTVNVARAEFYKANKNILSKERFVATLDSRTTLTCAGFDGKYFEVGYGPQPPLHYRCRSVRVGMVAERFGLKNIDGDRPQVGASGPGTTKATTTFNSFFKRQPASWQKDYLGEERHRLYKKGRLNIDQFTDDTGRMLSIDEVAARV